MGLTKKPKVEWVCVLFYHILVSSAVALMVVGIINLTDSTNLQHPSGSGLLKAGFSIIFVCWFLLAGWTISCCFLARNSSAAGASSPFSTDQEPKAEEGRSAYRRRQLAAVGQSQGANNASLVGQCLENQSPIIEVILSPRHPNSSFMGFSFRSQ